MDKEMARLLYYANQIGKGHWLVNGEDAIPALEKLQELGLIERSEDGKNWRLPE